MYANRFELDQCILDSLAYCARHEDQPTCENFAGLLEKADRDMKKVVANSDSAFITWKHRDRAERLAWKHVARGFGETQEMLRKVNATGFVDQKVMYWDHTRLLPFIEEMIGYLQEEKESIDFAESQAEALKRLRASAQSARRESLAALKEYKRQAQMRSDAMTTLVNTVASFRRALRRDLGRHHEEYQKIRWPYAVASDEAVL